MNIFFLNNQIKERLDNYWDNKNYIYFQIDDYKNSKNVSRTNGNISEED